jgi:hypothetical protein
MVQPPPHFRFTIRALLILLFAVAICFAFPIVPLCIACFIPLSGPLTAIAAFFFVRSATRSDDTGSRFHWPGVAGWIALCGGALPLIVTLFIYHRWVHAFDTDWPRPFPYPDRLLLAIHDWWDRLHPAADGAIKLHGEYFTLLLGINVLVLLACFIFGAVCGYVFRHGSFLAAWRRWT